MAEVKDIHKPGQTDVLLVSIDFSSGDKDILLVGRKTPEKGLDVINWFQDDEARDLYSKLINKKGE